MEKYYVYILTNVSNKVLYIGVTGDIERRISEHKAHAVKGFTDKYNATKCVYTEEFSDVRDAIAREKQLKGWTRKRKFELINTVNPKLDELFE